MRNIVFALSLLSSSTSFSQDYPARAVRVLVGYPPGGGMDTIARVLAPKLGEALGQQFVVENAVTSPQRLPSAPGWPAMAETVPGFSAAPSVFFVAPAGTPQAVVLKLNGAIRGALGSRDVEENFAKQGATATPGTPEELRAQIAEEVKRWAALVKDAGIRLE